ncbi:MAG: hypothetical protein QM500_04435 [Methylococcales bacterium]
MNSILFNHRSFTNRNNGDLCDFSFFPENINRFSLLGIGDFGEFLIDGCIKEKLLDIDYTYVNSNELYSSNCAIEYREIYSDESFISNSHSNSSELVEILPVVNMQLRNKKYFLIAVDAECNKSLDVLNYYIDSAKSCNCLIIVLIKLPVLPLVSSKSIKHIVAALKKADSILEIPCLYELDHDYSKYHDANFYKEEIMLYTYSVMCLSQNTFKSSDVDVFIKQGKYIRFIMPCVRENDIEVEGDIKATFEFDYPELRNQVNELSEDILVQLDVTNERFSFELVNVISNTFNTMFPGSNIFLTRSLTSYSRIFGSLYVLLTIKDIDIESMLMRKGRYLIDMDSRSLLNKRIDCEFQQHMKKFGCSSVDANIDMVKAYAQMKSIYSSEDKIINNLNIYSQCYDYDIKADSEYVALIDKFLKHSNCKYPANGLNS